MNEQDLKNKEIFLECMKRYDGGKLEDVQPLYIEDLNIIRTIFLWMYPPFLQEYANVKNSPEPLEQIEEPRMLGTFPVSKPKPRIDKYKNFCEKWNVSFRTSYTGLTSIDKILNPLNYARRPKTSRDEQKQLYPCSDYPSPVKPLSKLKSADLISSGGTDMYPDIRGDRGSQSKPLRCFLKSIGITSVKFHTLRACFATQLLSDGVR